MPHSPLAFGPLGRPATRSALVASWRGLVVAALPLLALPWVMSTSACGELSASVEAPTRLVTFKADGSAFASGASGANGTSVRAALVWRTRDAKGYTAADDTPLGDLAAGPFTFDVRRPPPEPAYLAPILVPSEGTPLRFAVGALVLYTDGNRSAALDLATGRAEEIAGDVVLATNSTFLAVWLERPPSESESPLLADRRGQVPTSGLNFQRITAAGAFWVRASEGYDLGAPRSAAFPDRVCSYLYESPLPDANPTSYDYTRSFPPAEALGLVCSDRGRSFSFQGCVATGLCRNAAIACRVDVRSLGATEAAPSGWPCAL